jgi:dynein heavy chain 1
MEFRFVRLLLIKTFRPDLLISEAQSLFDNVIGLDQVKNETQLGSLLNDELDLRPILISFANGTDVFDAISVAAAQSESELITVAMGSPESVELAEEGLANARRRNSWLLLENVHLAAGWIQSLETQLDSFLSTGFRLILTSPMNQKLPAGVRLKSRLVVIESADGLPHKMETALRKCNDVPTVVSEFSRIQFLLAWAHSVILERLRFRPVGWTKGYDFMESDLTLALLTAEDWIRKWSQSRSHICPESIPWNALLPLTLSIYGDKVDNDFDHRVLKSLMGSYLRPEMFDCSQQLSFSGTDSDSVSVPKGTKIRDFIDWTRLLPADDPSLLGFYTDFDEHLKAQKGSIHFLVCNLSID